jgi:hypothetical protein
VCACLRHNGRRALVRSMGVGTYRAPRTYRSLWKWEVTTRTPNTAATTFTHSLLPPSRLHPDTTRPASSLKLLPPASCCLDLSPGHPPSAPPAGLKSQHEAAMAALGSAAAALDHHRRRRHRRHSGRLLRCVEAAPQLIHSRTETMHRNARACIARSRGAARSSLLSSSSSAT